MTQRVFQEYHSSEYRRGALLVAISVSSWLAMGITLLDCTKWPKRLTGRALDGCLDSSISASLHGTAEVGLRHHS